MQTTKMATHGTTIIMLMSDKFLIFGNFDSQFGVISAYGAGKFSDFMGNWMVALGT